MSFKLIENHCESLRPTLPFNSRIPKSLPDRGPPISQSDHAVDSLGETGIPFSRTCLFEGEIRVAASSAGYTRGCSLVFQATASAAADKSDVLLTAENY